jgi:CheY-like chemotaxis protein
MVTALVAIALLGAVASIAIAVALVAIRQARAARRAGDQKRVESIDLARTVEADSRLADDVAHGLNDFLTAITGHAELLIASLDPSGASIWDAHEIRRAALSAARLTKRLRTLSGGHRADVPATSERTLATDRTPAETQLTAPVLVVEDEPGMREFIRLALIRAGHQVLAVSGARAALDALRRRQAIALMLVDVVMPEMDGYEVVAEARKISPSVHVVFISAFAPDPTRQPCGDGFLAKPFTSESLTGIVEKALSH